jgi:SnoaL-like domain
VVQRLSVGAITIEVSGIDDTSISVRAEPVEAPATLVKGLRQAQPERASPLSRTPENSIEDEQMSDATRALIQRHWALANQRNWPAFAELLAPGLRYDVPQTREFIDGAQGYLDLFATWPGDWRVEIQDLICEGRAAVCRIAFIADGELMTGISYFTLDAAGKIERVVDYWPAPYEPPPRTSRFMQRN